MRSAVAGTSFPLRLPSADPARATAATVISQLDDYALPRLTDLDAPMLVVVGGSTGAGKSTLVNSLVQAPVSATGVLRPTTRAPVLVCHPADARWFRGDRLLGGLPRTTTPAASTDRDADPHRLTIMAAPALVPGLAFLDAPDIESVVTANRQLSDQLFAAADLWLFLTTPARYADAVPWRLLHTARERGTVVALVLSRVPAPATAELVDLFAELLTANNLADLPLFVLPETRVDRQGQLPEAATAPLRRWFDGLAGDDRTRAGVIRFTLDGALAAVPARLAELATAADE
ncbi:MAG: dynamin family protein, partial [Natronosporangium sp.]